MNGTLIEQNMMKNKKDKSDGNNMLEKSDERNIMESKGIHKNIREHKRKSMDDKDIQRNMKE